MAASIEAAIFIYVNPYVRHASGPTLHAFWKSER